MDYRIYKQPASVIYHAAQGDKSSIERIIKDDIGRVHENARGQYEGFCKRNAEYGKRNEPGY